jgi:hypothetical protein
MTPMENCFTLTRRSCLALGVAAFAARPAPAAARRPSIVELFTSQGCSSCPPADAFMEELVGRKDVIALSYSVDYWDYLGWKDTLGSPENSKRQYDYAKARGDMDVYTPQMVIDGAAHYVGSGRAKVAAGMAASLAAADDWVPLEIGEDGKELVIAAGGAKGAAEGTIWLMAVAPVTSVEIKRGENAGKQVVYHNSVRKIEAVGMWKGNEMSIRVPKEAVMVKGASAVVALLQSGHVGAVLGAARLGQVSG